MRLHHVFLSLFVGSIVLTAKENGLDPQSQFFCNGTIHGYIRLPDRQQGTHTLEGIWTTPQGRVQQHSQDSVHFDPPGRSTAYVWFTFPERPAFGISPEADTERLSYNGGWTLQVRWDDQPLLSSTFSVTCR